MPFDEALAARVRDALGKRRNLAEKRLFGGLGFLLRGNMLVCVWKRFLIVRLGHEQAADALLEPYVKEFDVTGKAMKGWVMVEAEGVAEDDALNTWVTRALKFAAKLPAK